MQISPSDAIGSHLQTGNSNFNDISDYGQHSTNESVCQCRDNSPVPVLRRNRRRPCRHPIPIQRTPMMPPEASNTPTFAMMGNTRATSIWRNHAVTSIHLGLYVVFAVPHPHGAWPHPSAVRVPLFIFGVDKDEVRAHEGNEKTDSFKPSTMTRW
ncbi:hypothetical protein ARMGADRAFT_1007516 [Armillaria gallica]|uniref:Uncharacterized protein n=1 Tax=Armillaria gallica TaxID=47427 RepID=A0A2H3DW98_ARMGA|nr:hypothetical protein ARMGADRAFT_1013541 [Armillaria gallica]PBK98858.1 hypothetical protein ARMGADRAFT_1007516 [Armillaria gallica]